MNVIEKIVYYGVNICTFGVPYLFKIIIKKAIIEAQERKA
jgi:hypothetical protein